MERLERLIKKIRAQTHTEDYSSTEGISDETLVTFFNDAQKTLRALIDKSAPETFIKTSTINLVASQEEYSLPVDSLVGVNVFSVAYKYGSDSEYTRLRQVRVLERDSDVTGTPERYVYAGNKIWVNPLPSSSVAAGLRVTYGERLRDVDIRRGVVDSVDSPLTTISCDLTPTKTKDAGVPAAGAIELIDTDFVCIVDKDGEMVAEGVEIDSYNTTSGVISVAASYTLPVGTVISAGDYVVVGDYTSTHSEFPDFCIPYLMAYVKLAIYKDIGHQDISSAASELQEQAAIITSVFESANTDITEIPQIDPYFELS